MVGQQRHIFNALAQRRHVEWNHVQPVKQIFAKISALDFFFQILVGGRHHANIHLNGCLGAHRLEALLLQRPQNFGLGLQAHVAHFVQKERPAVGLLQLAGFIFQ